MSIHSMAGTEVEQVTLAGNLPYTLPVGLAPNRVHRVVFTQDATGGRTVTYSGQPVAVDLTAGASTVVELHPVAGGYVVRYWPSEGGGGLDTKGVQDIVGAMLAEIEPGIPEGATLDALPDSSTRKAVTPAMKARIDASMQASPDATMTRFRGAITGIPADLVAGDWWIDTTVVTP